MTDRARQEWQALARAARDYATLRQQAQGLELPEIVLVGVTVTTDDMALDAEAFRQVLAAFAEERAAGWARFRSVVTWSPDTEWPDFEEAGPPIFAEWTSGPARSCRLRLLSGDGPARARLWTFEERPLGADDEPAPGEVCALREARGAVARAAPAGITGLSYHVFWGAEPHEDVHALRRRFDRFAGFVEE